MAQQRIDRRRTLANLAGQQKGYFLASQAVDAGYSYQAQKYHTDRGNWIRIDRGLYRLRDWPVGPYDDLVRWSLWSRGRAVISHETALDVHDLGDVNPSRIHLTVPSTFHARSAQVHLHRADLDPSDISEHDGYRVTTPLRTLLDAAVSDLDQDYLTGAVDDARSRDPTIAPRLLRIADAFGPRAALRIERALAEL